YRWGVVEEKYENDYQLELLGLRQKFFVGRNQSIIEEKRISMNGMWDNFPLFELFVLLMALHTKEEDGVAKSVAGSGK
ncbi:hypothetical protein HAX54_021844, partial [Datura stramonium]|nr:hypothetical protein [Datura stramonium]